MEEKISQNGTTEEGQDKKSAKKAAKHHDGGVADLERVTDYAEEKELSSADISNVRLMALPFGWFPSCLTTTICRFDLITIDCKCTSFCAGNQHFW